MKRLVAGGTALLLAFAALAFSDSKPAAMDGGLIVERQERNPWTHLRVADDPESFQFMIVSDRTGGHRARVFSRAVEQINLMQPEFVLSVGDLIEGYTEDTDQLTKEWREFQGMLGRLTVPFFYVPGNHDLTNMVQEGIWKEKFGRRYYHFVYKNVLFLVACSEDPAGSNSMSAEQLAYMKKALEENPGVRWTVVAIHKPIWTAPDLTQNGWAEFESLLAGRKYTVFAGHVHRYQKYVRNGMNYYQLATTGGISRMRGVRYGEFDHLVWVTMGKTGPTIANLLMDGILPEDLEIREADESGYLFLERKAVAPVKGRVFVDGVALADAVVGFHAIQGGDPRRSADGLSEADGSFLLSTYAAFDGAPPGEYAVTVVKPGTKLVPAKYSRKDTTPLRATVQAKVTNEITLELTAQD